MTVSAAQVRALVALGIEGDKLAAVIDVMEMRDASRDGPLTPAERSKSYRDRRRHETRDEPSRDASVTKTPLSSSSKPEVQEPKKENKKEAAPKTRGHALPDDWRPAESHYRIGSELHRTRQDVDHEADAMRLWAKANAHRAVARKSDWDSTFTGWLRRTWGQNGGTNGQRSHHASRQSGADDFFAGLAEVAASLGGHGDVARPADEDLSADGRVIEH